MEKQHLATKGLNVHNNDNFAAMVLQSLPMGVISYNKELKILNANSAASTLIDVQEQADVTLSAGTNEKIWGNWRQAILNVITTGKICKFDNVGYSVNGNDSSLQITLVPMYSSDSNEIIGGIMLLENVTEITAITKQQAHTERLAVLGKLASKVAHELNNPIDGIMRYINLAKRTIISEQDHTKPLEYLEYATGGLKRMVQIITELLEFSRNKNSPAENTPIDKIIEDAVKFVEPAARAAGVEIDRQCHKPLPKTENSNLFQVFCNLLKNAIEAMPDGGKIIIGCEIAGDNVVVIKFRDTGEGFEPQNSEAIFEPFFTTKTSGKGTGLGLAICRDIIEKYGGKITAENAPDKGSIFTVYLPMKE
jgi:signal transduction histidine kinase